MINKPLLLSLQIEYETSDIDPDHLALKYDLNPEDTQQLVEAAKDWNKDIVPATPIVPTTPTEVDIVPDTKKTIENIEIFKAKAVEHALHFINKDAQFADVKEFKDMVSIVDAIDKSYKDKKDTGPTVNVMIQSLVQKFQDTPDDC